MIEFTLDIKGKSTPRPRVTKYGVHYPRPYQAYKKLLEWKLGRFNPAFLLPVRVTIEFTFIPSKTYKRNKYQSPPCDIDNLAKGILDAMNGSIYADDVLVEELSVSKKYGDRDHIRIVVEETL